MLFSKPGFSLFIFLVSSSLVDIIPQSYANEPDLSFEEGYRDADGNITLLASRKSKRGFKIPVYLYSSKGQIRLLHADEELDRKNPDLQAFRFYDARLKMERAEKFGLATKVATGLQIKCGGKISELQPIPDNELKRLEEAYRAMKPESVRAAPIRLVSFVAKVKNEDTYIYADWMWLGEPLKPDDGWGAIGQRVFVGQKGRLKRVTLKSIESFLDGGTMNIILDDGSSIYVPAPQKRAEATFKGSPLEILSWREDRTTDNLLGEIGIDIADIQPIVPTPCDFAFPRNNQAEIRNPKVEDSFSSILPKTESVGAPLAPSGQSVSPTVVRGVR